MTIAKVYIMDEDKARRNFYGIDSELVVAVKRLMAKGVYRWIGTFETDKQGRDAAEDMFDLSNNPERDTERDQRWGHNRSLAVGDIVQVGDEHWVCASVGWKQI